MLSAITRAVSPSINQCELSCIARDPIDYERAVEQHKKYEGCLRELGVSVVSLSAEPELPDSMFVEDPAVVVDEVAVITRMGAESRRGESESVAATLAKFRPLRRMRGPATLEGGDVLRIGTDVYVGLSARTNREGIAQLTAELEPFGYKVHTVEIRGCLHLKSASTYVGNDTVLLNGEWIDKNIFRGLRIIDVPRNEPRAANALAIGNTVLLPAVFPATAELLVKRGFNVRTLDISELMKAEAGLTCSSILFET